jgi:hypothetical protein
MEMVAVVAMSRARPASRREKFDGGVWIEAGRTLNCWENASTTNNHLSPERDIMVKSNLRLVTPASVNRTVITPLRRKNRELWHAGYVRT